MESNELFIFLRDQVELFKNFPENCLWELIQGSQVITFEGNEAVMKCGEEGRFLGILLEGKAEASLSDNSGKKVRLSILEPGSIFGEIALMTGSTTVANILGITRCTALMIPQKLFSTILISQPSAIRYLSRSIAQRTTQWSVKHNFDSTAVAKNDDPYGLKLKTEHPVKLLIINCGSSSLKYAFFDTGDDSQIVRGSIECIGSEGINHSCNCKGSKLTMPVPANGGHREAFLSMIDALQSPQVGCIRDVKEIGILGHRVLHGGDKFIAPVEITDEVIAAIEEVSSLGPLHNPVNLIGIREGRMLFPHASHVAVFDTDFHHTMPPYAYMYGLPYELYKEKKIRRYGFHGTSHFYVSLMASEFLKRPYNALNIISCHLGNGSSLCAVEHGRSVDTTMGLTPADGLMMGTRCGSIDPGIIVHLMKTENLTADQIDTLVNKQSGLKGISGISNDMREIEKAALQGHHRALLAYKMFCYQIRKYIGSYVAAMQGVDVVVFTGGIGQGSAAVRSTTCQGLACMGVEIDEKKNMTINGFAAVHDISADGSRVRVLVVPTDEERMIARESLRTVGTKYLSGTIPLPNEIPVPVEVSAHHVHISQADLEVLFGAGHTLTPVSDLSQPEQYASKETVNLIGAKGRIDRVRILGPVRRETQVEISLTEQYKLGVFPPIRESGDLDHTPGITLEGPAGTITITHGVICALRHIHMTPEDALKFGLRDKNKVRVRVESSRELIFGDVVVRVSPKYKLAMHIDTDEANAGNVGKDVVGYIEAIQTAN